MIVLSLPQKRAHRHLIKPFVRIKQFRIMYLRTVLQKRALSAVLWKTWMRHRKSAYTQNCRRDSTFLPLWGITHLTGRQLFMKELENILSVWRQPRVTERVRIVDRVKTP